MNPMKWSIEDRLNRSHTNALFLPIFSHLCFFWYLSLSVFFAPNFILFTLPQPSLTCISYWYEAQFFFICRNECTQRKRTNENPVRNVFNDKKMTEIFFLFFCFISTHYIYILIYPQIIPCVQSPIYAWDGKDGEKEIHIYSLTLDEKSKKI